MKYIHFMLSEAFILGVIVYIYDQIVRSTYKLKVQKRRITNWILFVRMKTKHNFFLYELC